MIRRWHLVVFVLLGLMALACEEGGGSGGGTPDTSYPSSMAALGDSITAGVGSCGAYAVCRRNSWSTGTADAVDSHYRRILAKNSAIKGDADNFAEPGAEADALDDQAAKAVKAKAAYVTVLIGANDACAKTIDGMTPVATFRTEVDRALNRLKKGLPKSRVLVTSVPDLYRLWDLGKQNQQAVRVWNRTAICPSMFANPTSTADADEDRRTRVRDRIDDYDDQLRDACRDYGDRCRWDNGRVHSVRFGLDLVSSVDYFHPNAKGQNELADVTYRARW
ncbi:lipoprotein [Paractinoplanes tereljensis]|uniref:Lipoprotein n=1 Tax=Paractinoplanes tereljensis TaxID=571912 RepID=A0A919NHX6_9ACTN|nr:SGNH/GDSL hydrolase family protein [Actinoplanes tereljensis]GIF18991.1 lipoprotein [Actinoplanes tereljensis]